MTPPRPTKVILEYFSENGKWKYSGEYISYKEHLFEIWEEVKEKRQARTLPDLSSGSWTGPILVMSNHPNAHPHLVMPE